MYLSFLINFAGTPPTIEYESAPFVTTEPAPIIDPSYYIF